MLVAGAGRKAAASPEAVAELGRQVVAAAVRRDNSPAVVALAAADNCRAADRRKWPPAGHTEAALP